MAFQELIKGTPDWHEKYNSDFQDVHAQLANKVNQITIVTGADADALMPDRLAVKYWRAYEMAQNQPEGYTTDNDFFVTAQKVNNTKWGRQYAADVRSNAIFTRRSYEKEGEGIKFGPWLRLAFAEPPQEFMLPLMEGAAGWLRYSLDQTGFVHMQLYFTSTDGLDTHTLLAILPVGYRPLHAVVCPIVCRKSNGIHSGFLDIRADGSVYADTYGDGGKATYGGASFSFRAVVG